MELNYVDVLGLKRSAAFDSMFDDYILPYLIPNDSQDRSLLRAQMRQRFFDNVSRTDICLDWINREHTPPSTWLEFVKVAKMFGFLIEPHVESNSIKTAPGEKN